jgi:4-azaleucine resistance transporter AzlC
VSAVEPSPRPNPSRAFRRGVLATVPMQIATIPFGLVFGALAIEIGLNLTETMTMTILIVGGVSQLVALNMLAEQAPPLMVVLTAALVNLRMAMYSAAIAARWQGVGPLPRILAAWFLNDQSFAISLRRYDDDPAMPAVERSAFFLGSGACCLLVWICATLVGALVGTKLPEHWPLEFAVPVVFRAVPQTMTQPSGGPDCRHLGRGIARPAAQSRADRWITGRHRRRHGVERDAPVSGSATIWIVIIGLGIATALIRYSFLGLLQGREIPPRMKSALGFVPATVLPALVAPMVIFAPQSDRLGRDTLAEPHRLIAALAALGIGMVTRSMLAAVVTGMATFVVLRAAGL